MAYRVTSDAATGGRATARRGRGSPLARNALLAGAAIGSLALIAAGAATFSFNSFAPPLGAIRSTGPRVASLIRAPQTKAVLAVLAQAELPDGATAPIQVARLDTPQVVAAAPEAKPEPKAERIPLPHARPRQMVAAIPLPRERPVDNEATGSLGEPEQALAYASTFPDALPTLSSPGRREAASPGDPDQDGTNPPKRDGRDIGVRQDAVLRTAMPGHDKQNSFKTAVLSAPPIRLAREAAMPAVKVAHVAPHVASLAAPAKHARPPTVFEKLYGPVRVASLNPADGIGVGGGMGGGEPRPPFDQQTAVYVISSRKVYLPDGRALEAHSGLGEKMDDPRFVRQRMVGATPPHVYDLTMRESLFHGVEAIRMNPVGGDEAIFGRAGILAHTYMLGPNGQSNGCVSFADYDAFLDAFKAGKITRMAVIARLD